MERRSVLLEYSEALLVALVLALYARTFVVQAFKIPSSSMERTLLVGDHIFVNKFIYGDTVFAFERVLLPVREIRRGDVIVFKYPGRPDLDYIKRVIGVGGDEIYGVEGVVYVNHRPLLEPYAVHRHAEWGFALRDTFASKDQPIRVPPGHYFVMGDNRDNSEDSRYWGTVPDYMIKGRAFLIYWSFEPPASDYYSPHRNRTGLEAVLDFLSVLNPLRTRWSRMFRVIH